MTPEEASASAEISADLLLSAVKAFLVESAAHHLEGRDRFNARVAANVLGIVQREQALGPALQALDQEAAIRWLPPAKADESIAQQLSRALASRELAPDSAVFDYLKARQLLVTAINNPKYASRAVAEARWQGA